MVIPNRFFVLSARRLQRGWPCRGFTLIELMIVVVVMSVVAAIAVPTYTEYTRRAARGDAMGVLTDVRLQQERHRLSNTTYSTTLSSLSIDSSSPNGRYSLAIVSAGAAGFSATATPTGSQAGDSCGTYAIDQNGPDTTGSYADDTCWRR